jgi:choice-of-anchor C domain-containing protein
MRKSIISSSARNIALGLSCLAITATTAHANLLVNGSFEQGPGFFTSLNPGSTAVTGWVVTRAQIDYDPGWQTADGIKSLDLNGSPGIGGIEQTFATVSNQQYVVTFAMAANPTTARLSSMGVQAAGQSTSFTFDSTGHTSANMGWVTDNWTFTALGTNTTLEFFSTDTQDANIGPALDNVSVAAVPEPGAILLAVGGIFSLACIEKWRLTARSPGHE